jgi:hypothetical protein
VGFPEGIEFLHPERLTITTAKGQILAAEDAFAQESPAANVGQYKMQDILTQLPVTEAIELSLPLDNPRSLTIPTPVLLEWQSLLFSVNGGNPNHPATIKSLPSGFTLRKFQLSDYSSKAS